jgi:hypothetical protein
MSDTKVYPSYLDYPKPRKKQTNADKYFRNASDEEIAQFLSDIAGFLPMYEGKVHPILKWLKQEANE